jgi:hypothetical protein
MHDGESVGNMSRNVPGSKFPNEMVSDLDNGPGPTNVFGSDPTETTNQSQFFFYFSKIINFIKTYRWG